MFQTNGMARAKTPKRKAVALSHLGWEVGVEGGRAPVERKLKEYGEV